MVNFLKRRRGFIKGEKGEFVATGVPKKFNKTYTDSIVKYLNCLDLLFEKSQQKSEFEFIFTLLRFRGIQYTKEDPYENSLETFDAIMKLGNKIHGDPKINLFLWLYGHIVESSEPYEILANLLNICNGGRYQAYNFPRIRTKWGYRDQFPTEKIQKLEVLANKASMINVLEPIKYVFDKDLRNSIFHSDYSGFNGEIIINNPQKIYSAKVTQSLINKALAYHEVVKNLIRSYREGYKESKLIKVSPGFSPDPDEKAVLIIRENDGAIGMKDSWTKEEIKNGKISFFAGHIFSDEQKYLDQGVVVLPSRKQGVLKRIINTFFRKE